MPLAVLCTMARQQLHRHGVEHFVAHHHAVELRVGQRIHPAHLVAKPAASAQLLAGAQAARDIDDGVAAHGAAQAHPAAAAASAPEPAPNSQTSSVPVRASASATCTASGLAKQRRHLGGGDKVAARLTGRVPNLGSSLA
jgi:hypothetical protein